MDDTDLMEFGAYLSNIKRLGNRTLHEYLFYARLIDLDLLGHQEYVDAFILSHKNNSVVRGMMLNLLRYKSLHKKIDMPERATGTTKKRLIRPISKEEINIISKGLHSNSFKHGLIFDLIYQGALRRAEIPTIRINSFQWLGWLEDTSDFCKLIVLGKGDKERTVLINPKTAQSIFDFYASKLPNIDLSTFINSRELLFKSPNGDQLTEKIVYDVVKRGSRKYLGRDMRTHELRHARATELEKQGINIKDIKNYLGHANLTTTEMYLHRSESESLEAIRSKLEK